MNRVLVSACLLGEPVRHDGRDKRCDHEILRRWLEEGRVVPVCPETAGGLPVPRTPAEIEGGAGGGKVLSGHARVVDRNGGDVTRHFVSGAEAALALAQRHGIRVAVLKEGSPSCGSGFIYDGTFTSAKVRELGVAAASLRQAGLHVFSEHELADADRIVRELDERRT